MSTLKTQRTDASVADYLAGVTPDYRRRDATTVLKMMRRLTDEEPKMWGTSLVGFGSYRYRYKSGKEGEWFLTGLSPRKQALTIYIMPGFSEFDRLMQRLGKFTTGKSCLYIKKLEDIDTGVLETLIERSVAMMKARYEA